MKTYHGNRTEDGLIVTVSDGDRTYPLNPRHDLRNHSPDGFSIGYNGSGPAQLSLALLADALDDDIAQETYQTFKRKIIARLDGDSFTLTQQEIVQAVAAIEAERGRRR